MSDKILITVAGSSKSGKSTLINEFYRALQKANFPMKNVDCFVTIEDDLHQGKKMDAIASISRNDQLIIEFSEVQTSRSEDEDDRQMLFDYGGYSPYP